MGEISLKKLADLFLLFIGYTPRLVLEDSSHSVSSSFVHDCNQPKGLEHSDCG